MKIAYISPMLLPLDDDCGGAVEQLMLSFIKENEINTENLYIDVYTLPLNQHHKYKFSNFIEINKSKIETVIQKTFNFINKIFLFSYYPFNLIHYKVAVCVKKKKYDAIFIENSMLLFKQVYHKLENKTNKPKFYYHLHNNLGDIDKNSSNYKYILKRAENIFCVSDFIKNELNKIEFSEKNVTIHNCINKSDFTITDEWHLNIKKIRKKYEIESDIVIGFVGRTVEDKGIIELFEAFIKLSKEIQNIKLLIVGSAWFSNECNEYNDFEKKLKKILEKYKDKIILTGFVPHNEVKYYYTIMDILVIPSKCDEAFGMVALEGLILNIPILTTGVGGLKEVLNEYATYVEVNDLSNQLYCSLKNSLLNKSIKPIIPDSYFNQFSQEKYYKDISERLKSSNENY